MIKKIFGIFICMLFIGISVSSAISIDTNSTKSKKVSIKDCGCKTKTDDSIICNMLEFRVNELDKKMKFFYGSAEIILEILIRLNLKNIQNYFIKFVESYINFLVMHIEIISAIAYLIGCSWYNYPKISNFQIQLKNFDLCLKQVM